MSALSRLDLPRVTESIEAFYRLLEAAPLQLQQFVEEATEIVHLLAPSSLSPTYDWTDEIVQSELLRNEKSALLKLREKLTSAINLSQYFTGSDALLMLGFLE